MRTLFFVCIITTVQLFSMDASQLEVAQKAQRFKKWLACMELQLFNQTLHQMRTFKDRVGVFYDILRVKKKNECIDLNAIRYGCTNIVIDLLCYASDTVLLSAVLKNGAQADCYDDHGNSSWWYAAANKSMAQVLYRYSKDEHFVGQPGNLFFDIAVAQLKPYCPAEFSWYFGFCVKRGIRIASRTPFNGKTLKLIIEYMDLKKYSIKQPKFCLIS